MTYIPQIRIWRLLPFILLGVARALPAVDAGRELFEGACSACHGPNGEGGHGPSLVDGWQVRRASDQALFDSIKAGVPGTDMPPSPLPDEKIRLLVTFVGSLGRRAIASDVNGDDAAGR